MKPQEHIRDIVGHLLSNEVGFGTLLDAGNGYIQVVIEYEVGGKLRCYDVVDKRYIVYKKGEYHFGELGLSIVGDIKELTGKEDFMN